MSQNLLLDTDSYKQGHFQFYPPGLSYASSYLEARENDFSDSLVFFGLTPIIKRLAQGFTKNDIYEASAVCQEHGVPFNKAGWLKMYSDHGGQFPVLIRALPEGTRAPVGVPLLITESTNPEYAWLPSWLETQLMRVWYPITVATKSALVKHILLAAAKRTCDNTDHVRYQLHDFGSRGVSCPEQAAIGGAAHLTQFMGTDTMAALQFIQQNYPTQAGLAVGHSVPATEHSTVTTWGRNGEQASFRHALEQIPNGILSVVSDTYNLKEAVQFWCSQSEAVTAQSTRLVVRPDSGDPVATVLYCVHALAKAFGTTQNSLGFNELNNCSVIQGDGIDIEQIEDILSELEKNKFASSNVVFGMGAGLLQKVNRDTLRFAYKTSYAHSDKYRGPVGKDPTTDPTKKQKMGLVDTTYSSADRLVCVYRQYAESTLTSALTPYYSCGEVSSYYDFDSIRRAASLVL